jgi:nucleoside-diphosphate-sugar epimerase
MRPYTASNGYFIPLHLFYFMFQKPKDEQTVIGPAVKGTLDMLRAANKTATVSKFILTLSCAAIDGGHEDKKSFTEEDWTNVNARHVSAVPTISRRH